MITYIDMMTSHIDWSYSFNVLVVSPDVIFLAVNVSVSFETRQLVGKFHPAVRALQASRVPLGFNCTQIKFVHDPQTTSRAQRGTLMING